MSKSHEAGTVTDKHSMEVALGGTLHKGFAVRIGSLDVSTIFRQGCIGFFVCTIELGHGEVLSSVCDGIRDSNTKIMFDIAYDFRGTVAGLIFEFIKEFIGQECCRNLFMPRMMNSHALMLMNVSFDAKYCCS